MAASRQETGCGEGGGGGRCNLGGGVTGRGCGVVRDEVAFFAFFVFLNADI